MKKTFYTILACTAILSGCRDTMLTENGTGILTFNLNCNQEEYSDKVIGVKSGDEGTSAVDINEFEVIINSSTGSYTKSFLYKDVPSMLELSAGSYTVSAHSPNINSGMAAWNSPEYAGSKTFEVAVGKISTVDLACSLSNMKVSINCSDKFLNELSDFVITVSQETSSLTWQRQEVIDSKAGYFPVAPLTVFVSGTRAIDNSTATVTFKITNVAAKDHHVINIDATTTGSSKFELSIDTTTNDKNVEITVPGFDQNPVPDPDPENPEIPDVAEAPSMVWAANPDFETVTIAEEMDVNIVVKAPGKIKEFKVTVSENFAEMVGAMGAVDGEMDLINNETIIGNLEDMLPTGDQLLNQTEVNFSLSGLVPLIGAVGNPGEDYTFTLYVQDALGQSLTKVCKFYNPAE
ncbi:MAG: DUF4493 domain-containing protein [Bacteroidales bacterium]|nr:DUF4493 domain-containing protein [Bacteroidales bacterium]